MATKAQRLQQAGGVVLLLVAMIHTFGHAVTTPPEMTDLIALEQRMAEVHIDMGLGEAWAPSMDGVVKSLSLMMSLALVFMGLANLLACHGEPGADGRIAQRLAILTAVVNAALVALFAWYRIAPPTITLAVAEVFFVLAVLLRARGAMRV